MEMSCTLRLTLVNGILIWKESCKIQIFMRIFPTKKHLLRQKTKMILHCYKNPKLSENKIRIIDFNSGTLELWKFFNLTFRGSLAGITLILCIGFFFFFFVVQILSRAHAVYWQFLTSLGKNRIRNLGRLGLITFWPCCICINKSKGVSFHK